MSGIEQWGQKGLLSTQDLNTEKTIRNEGCFNGANMRSMPGRLTLFAFLL